MRPSPSLSVGGAGLLAVEHAVVVAVGVVGVGADRDLDDVGEAVAVGVEAAVVDRAVTVVVEEIAADLRRSARRATALQLEVPMQVAGDRAVREAGAHAGAARRADVEAVVHGAVAVVVLAVADLRARGDADAGVRRRGARRRAGRTLRVEEALHADLRARRDLAVAASAPRTRRRSRTDRRPRVVGGAPAVGPLPSVGVSLADEPRLPAALIVAWLAMVPDAPALTVTLKATVVEPPIGMCRRAVPLAPTPRRNFTVLVPAL